MIELRPEEQRLLETAPLLNWRRTARGNRSLTLYGITVVVSHRPGFPDPYGVSICVDGRGTAGTNTAARPTTAHSAWRRLTPSAGALLRKLPSSS